MEIVAKISQKSQIEYNKEEIEKELSLIEEKYLDLTFTEEQVKEAKEERAKINKLTKALADYRKNVVNEAMEEIKPFEIFMKEAERRADNLSKEIDKQIKAFEENEKIERLAKVVEYIEQLLMENPKYSEFKEQLAPSMDNALYTNKGSFSAKGEVGTKIVEYVQTQLSQFDEILKAREEQENILQEKRELIISQCKSISEMMELKISLSPKQFSYLKDYQLSEITLEIQRAGQEQAKKEREAIEKIEKEAYEKAERELQQEQVEVVQESVQEIIKEVIEEKKVVSEKREVAKEKLFYATVEFNGISIKKAKMFKSFLIENEIEYKTIKQETK